MNVYQKTKQELAKEFSTDLEHGLSQNDATQRLKRYGQNALPEGERESWFIVFLRQFKSPLIYVLCIAALIVLIAGEKIYDAFIIAVILLFNAVIGMLQEGRARTILEGLRKLSKTTSLVIRDGHEELIDDTLLVPGDIIVIQDGSKVPADARIIEAHNVRVDEAILTGESDSVQKTAHVLKHVAPIYEQHNMIFKGTYVTAGVGKALVVATGIKTEIGSIQKSIEGIETDMPLKKEIDRIARLVIVLVAIVCAFFFVFGLWQQMPLYDLFMTLVALFVSSVPEGLPVVLTIALAVGAYRLAQRNVLIRKMQAVEGLGRVNVIMIDKTGTLTRNELMVSRVVTAQASYEITGEGYFEKGEVLREGRAIQPSDDAIFQEILVACVLLSHAQLRYDKQTKTFEVKGDPTNAALSVLARKGNVVREDLEHDYRRIFEIPFDSDWQYHAIFVEHKGTYKIHCVGSPDVLCARASARDICQMQKVHDMLDSGLRVLAVATKFFDASLFYGPEDSHLRVAMDYLKDAMNVVGFLGLNDAIRPEVAESIAAARSGGIRVIMATGDHAKTAAFVAQKTGILGEGELITQGTTIDRLSDEELKKEVMSINAYARVIPQQKMRIVKVLQEQGELVAMTGDGVNDAPALIASDLGIAMGGIGTEVAKQAADLILLDDSFTSIVEAVKQGRHIFYTLRRVVLYLFATNLGEILIITSSLLLSLPLPLTAVQILWLNLVTDGFLDVGLTLESRERGLLKDRWFLRKPKIIDSSFIFKMLFMSFPMFILSFLVFCMTYHDDLAYARSLTLLVMAAFQWFNAWNCRSETRSIVRLGIFSNRWLVGATAVVVALQLGLYYQPVMRRAFGVTALSLSDWLVALLIASVVLVLEEGRKAYMHYYRKKHRVRW
ncbi:HAD-IC family P-type ATPase [Candidatus Dependentiae bacterium]|nr:HAD-IC family P-type ATPase [Candidatus Dependentiae bacterium]